MRGKVTRKYNGQIAMLKYFFEHDAIGSSLSLLIISLSFCFFICACTHKREYFPNVEMQEVCFVRFDSALLSIKTEINDTAVSKDSEHTLSQDIIQIADKGRKQVIRCGDSSDIRQDIRRLYADYPIFMPTFVEDILGFAGEDTIAFENAMASFLNDTVYGFMQTNNLEQEVFADVTDIERELSEAFARISWLYPEWEKPTLYLFVSGFQSAIYFTEDGLAIGADMYLGKDYPYYNQVVYQYQMQTMRKECIPVDVVSAWLFSHIPYTSTKNRLLDQMMYRGKVMYLLSCIFDRLPGYEVMGYTKEQWDWCVYHERAIWHRMMDKRDLFRTEQRLITSYLNDGPFTSEISQDSPGRLGTWMGWRIVESYMEHNDTVSLIGLMRQEDAQLILEKSYYKP